MDDAKQLIAKVELLEADCLYLNKMLAAQLHLNTVIFKLLIQKDPRFLMEVAEVLRQLLTSPAVTLSPELEQLARLLRDGLVLPIPQEVVEASRQPSIRPVA